MNRKISVGDTLSEVFSIYGAQAGVLLPLAFLIYLAVAVITGIAAGSVFLLLVAFAVGIMAGILYQGVVVSLVRDVQDGKRDASMGGLIDEAMPFIGPLLGVGILAGIAIAIGLALFIVPGLILLTIWAVLAPVIVIEKSRVFDAFGRSRELVRGNGWPVFGVIVVAFLIVGVTNAVLTAIGGAIDDSVVLRIIFSLAASSVTAPVTALVAAVLYYRLQGAQGGPAATPPPGEAPDAPEAAAPPAS
jgi:MFS family permease